MAAKKKDSEKKTKQPTGSKKDPRKDRKRVAAAESTKRDAERNKGKQKGAADSSQTVSEQPFPIVGIGASAGGLEALETFFQNLTADSGIAIVVITHTDPKRASLLPSIIRRRSPINVNQIEDGMAIKPNEIYLPPSDSDLIISNEVFRLEKRQEKSELHLPVDRFFRSLAAARADRAGCVIMSGTGSDGTQGLRAIKEKSGVAAVQSPDSAKHSGMPASAIETGLVDYVLTPAEMPARLGEYFKHPSRFKTKPEILKGERLEEDDRLKPILSFLSNRTRNDFSLYKRGTMTRRIERRIIVTRSQNLDEYLNLLYRSEREVRALFQDLLIGVTSFFRDPDAFDQLKNEIITEMVLNKKKGESLRVWVPGCATGEEAYSVAILIKECLEEKNISRDMQVFGTDIDAHAIEKARTGEYLPNIAADVKEERLNRFFSRECDRFRVKRDIRELVVFAEQNLLRDPPFSELDMVVCRNLLIYLKPEAQDRLVPLFHYTLRKNGILFMGNSETIGRHVELFEPISKQHSIYRKKDTAVRLRVHFPTGRAAEPVKPAMTDVEAKEPDHVSIAEAVNKILVAEFTPTCIVVNELGEIIHTRGRTGKYLQLAQGKPNLNISDMARDGLRFSLLSAIRKVKEQRKPVTEKGLRVKTNGEHHWIDLTVKPCDQPKLEDTFLVVFQERSDPERPVQKSAAAQEEAPSDSDLIEELEQELMRLRSDYHSAMEELETSNEELQSSNEEMQSTNEELQATNEELESSREELQSLNEELHTVNSELQTKIDEIDHAYSAITDVLDSTRIAMVFLDNDLQVKRFTAKATELINLIDSDLSRPFEHISHNLDFDNLKNKADQVLKELKPFEGEVRTRDGHWYRMNIMVHRKEEHFIDGVVLTFVNIDAQKKAQQKIEEINRRSMESAQRLAENIVDTMREALLVLDDNFRILSANRRFYDKFVTGHKETEGKILLELGNGQWDIPELHNLLRETAEKRQSFEDFRVEHDFPQIGYKKMLLNARHLQEDDERENKILLVIEDVTDRE